MSAALKSLMRTRNLVASALLIFFLMLSIKWSCSIHNNFVCWYLSEIEGGIYRYQSLIAASAAIIAAKMTIIAMNKNTMDSVDAMNCQLQDAALARSRLKEDRARVYFGMIASYFSRMSDVLQRIVQNNNNDGTGKFFVPEAYVGIIHNCTIRNFISSPESLYGLPDESTEFFTQLRMDILVIEDVMDALRYFAVHPDKTTIENINDTIQKLYLLQREVVSSCEEFWRRHPALEPSYFKKDGARDATQDATQTATQDGHHA